MKPLFILALAGLCLAACHRAPALSVTTDDIAGGRFALPQMYNAEGCTGGNTSPALSWSGAPADAKSFAVTMFDPDANTGRGFYHWLVLNIPASVHGLKTGQGAADKLPSGLSQTNNDFGYPGYGGPCPPPGQDHHYVITVHALNAARLTLAPTTAPTEVMAEIRRHEIASGTLTAMGKR